MRQGGVRRLVIRPSLGYRGQARGKIPPNTTLVFDVRLLDVR
jgi:FKBP-type peptidyl-prolyl cis-trans isomerase